MARPRRAQRSIDAAARNGAPDRPSRRGCRGRAAIGVDAAHEGARLMSSMEVANPIYDVVFKYLMQDQRVARLLIGRITGLAVQSLTVSPQETSVRRTPEDPEHVLPLTLLRMDFAARVQTRDGSERQVLIEIQKASAPTVIERFRRYLGQQIGSGDNILTHSVGPHRGGADRDDLLPGLRPGWPVGRGGDRRVPAGDRAAHGAGAGAEPSTGGGDPSPQPHHPDTAAGKSAAGRVGAAVGDLRSGFGEGQRAC